MREATDLKKLDESNIPYEQYREHKRDKPIGFQKIKRKPKRRPK